MQIQFAVPEMEAVVQALPGPKAVWKFFMMMMSVPRGSGNTDAIRARLLEVGHAMGLEAVRDTVGNVVIRKPASAGYETRPSVCLQAHMDMVCEKEKGLDHDFDHHPLRPRILDGGKLMATGTTLGADNGIGCAMLLALLEDRTLEHGPIEALFTVDEETSMCGAQQIQAGFIHSRFLINVDSEEDWRICVGCAGGFEAHITMMTQWIEAPQATVLEVEVSSLLGGHSGVEIHHGRANGLKLMARLLNQARKAYPFLLCKMVGGTKKNVIPYVCQAEIACPCACPEAPQRLKAALEAQFAELAQEWHTVEPNAHLAINVRPVGPCKALDAVSTQKALDLFYTLPHGVLRMSPDVKGLVESSINLCKCHLDAAKDEGALVVEFLARSSNNAQMPFIHEQLMACARLAGARCSPVLSAYPGWLPNMESPLLAVTKKSFSEVMKKEPEIYAIHAGLECGMFQAKYPGLDCVSVGPYMTDVHSPKECLYVETVPKVYELLAHILKSLH